MYDEHPRRRRRPISATHPYSHHQYTLIHASSSTLLSVFFVHGFRFHSYLARFAIFFPPILSATFKNLSTIQSYIQTRPYRIDGGELARYTTPYLNSYGLVGPSTLRPALHIFLSYRTSNNASLIIINIHRRFSYMFFFSLGQTSNAFFFFSLHLSLSPSSYLFIRRFYLDSRSPRNLYSG